MLAAQYSEATYNVTQSPALYGNLRKYVTERCLADGDYVLVLGSASGNGWAAGTNISISDGLGNPVRAGTFTTGYAFCPT